MGQLQRLHRAISHRLRWDPQRQVGAETHHGPPQRPLFIDREDPGGQFLGEEQRVGGAQVPGHRQGPRGHPQFLRGVQAGRVQQQVQLDESGQAGVRFPPQGRQALGRTGGLGGVTEQQNLPQGEITPEQGALGQRWDVRQDQIHPVLVPHRPEETGTKVRVHRVEGTGRGQWVMIERWQFQDDAVDEFGRLQPWHRARRVQIIPPQGAAVTFIEASGVVLHPGPGLCGQVGDGPVRSPQQGGPFPGGEAR